MIERLISRSCDVRREVGLTCSDLMSHNTKIGIVTAAGYTEAERYYGRLHGLLDAIKNSTILKEEQKMNLMIMGKSFYFFHILSN